MNPKSVALIDCVVSLVSVSIDDSIGNSLMNVINRNSH